MTGYNIQIDKLCKMCALGELLCAPSPISSGLLHRMYDVKTSHGRFAIKALNPEIMERNDTYNNYVISEKIVLKLANVINASGANLYNGNHIQEVEGQFYLIYDFKEGKSLKQNEITTDHAYKIGVAVGKIHSTDFSELNIHNDNTTEARCFNWNDFLEIGRQQNKEWCDLLEENISILYFLSNKMNDAYPALSANEIICHGDLDSKNVLWLDNELIIIDWESAWFYNPYHDFLETALYWSLNDDSIAYERFSAFIKGYSSIKTIGYSDWDTVLYSGYSAKLGWLEYSLKRSLGIKCNNAEERKLGTEQVTATIDDILQYEKKSPSIINFLVAELTDNKINLLGGNTMQKEALVIIDIQNDITKNYKDVIGNINKAIDWAVNNNIHVIYIRHENLSAGTRTFKTNTHGSELASDLKIVSKNVFTKYKGNALTSEEFTDFISKNEICDFYITGADAVACVKSTCYNLCKANYGVNVLSDCITSYDKRKIDEMLRYYESQGSKIICLNDLLI